MVSKTIFKPFQNIFWLFGQAPYILYMHIYAICNMKV